ncbi:alpha/beta hydrolase [Telmatobacter bradus]|uniref:alpha/beta hydrolase n=1 Tax=Telmatobacter bradus TaxID=474953 RepID=UPI003B439F2F
MKNFADLRTYAKWGRVALALAAALASSLTVAAQGTVHVAATVEYETIPTPTLPPNGQPGIGIDQMKALPGSTLTYLSIKTVDGVKNKAALWRPVNKAAADTTMIISVHGGGNDFTQVPVRALGIGLSPQGYAVLAINDRQSGSENESRDNFYDISTDIDAALQTAKAMGYRRIVIHGQSLGSTHVLFYAATHWDPVIQGVIVSAAMANLPWANHNKYGNADVYQLRRKAAHEALKAGKRSERMQIDKGPSSPVLENHDTNPGDMPFVPESSAQFFVTYEDYLSAGADSTYWIHRIPHPVLVVRSESDGLERSIEGTWLLSAARDEGSLVPDMTYAVVPDTHPPSAEGHAFVYNADQYVDIVQKWLAARHL